MKKLLFLLVPFMVLMFSIKSYAYDSSNLTLFKNDFQNHYNHALSDAQANQILTKWEQTGLRYCVTYCNNDSSYNLRCGFSSNVAGSGNSYRISAPYYSSGENGGSYITSGTNMVWTGWSYRTSGYEDFNVYGWKWDSEIYLAEPIDWENPYYSANIPAPVFEVFNAELNVVPIVDVPLSFDFQFVPTNTYVEVWADYTIPTKLNVVPQPNNGAQYRVLDYNVVSVNVLDKELLYESDAINSSYMHVVLRDGWDDVLEGLPITDVEFITQAGTEAWLNNRIDEYEDLRKTNTLYGSAIKIKMRYFTIVDDTKFVVGPWRIWDSKNPETFTNELPTGYQVYLPANGTSGTNTDTSTNVDIPVGSGTPTGTYYDPSVNITVTQNVPNYPDYPTIASYNLDNMLVDTMNNVRGLNTFFGEFGGFIQSVFVFLPSWIWAIIGVGFSLSIIVMFLKIL